MPDAQPSFANLDRQEQCKEERPAAEQGSGPAALKYGCLIGKDTARRADAAGKLCVAVLQWTLDIQMREGWTLKCRKDGRMDTQVQEGWKDGHPGAGKMERWTLKCRRDVGMHKNRLFSLANEGCMC
eukprot:1159084-Pelagomonas_calceolata.AAC.16